MNHKTRYFLGFLLLLVTSFIVFLVSTSFRDSLQYYITVSELHAKEAQYQKRNLRLKVAGHAAQIEKVKEENKYTFHVEEGGKSLSVLYSGFVPDTFKEGSDVVVTGFLKPDGTFEAEEILAKCASKYEMK